jgi:short subunit dehydrogenase-like uncharacterized protein
MPEHDIAVFGATGFTGALTAEYLVEHAKDGTKLALAGRNRRKLEDLREALGRSEAELPLIEAEVGDRASLDALARSTKVVISTVGPYLHHGEPLVAACAEAGTDYVDLTGEPEFVDLMWLRYNEQAKKSGARLVHSCGFDAIPSDLGALFTVEQLPEGVPIRLEGFVTTHGLLPSGGTYHSLVNAMGRLREGVRASRERREAEPQPNGRRVKVVLGSPRHERAAGGWVAPLPVAIDPDTVASSARALERYGPDFSYSHYILAKHVASLAALGAGAATMIALVQLPPVRSALLKLRAPGDGPSPEQRAKARFRTRFIGEGGGRRVVADVTGADPGYGGTAKMLGESALCLVHDFLPDRAGQLTPATAMGRPLIDRLVRAGFGFEVVESG